MTEIKVDDGKYTVVFDYDGSPIRCLRHGEPWREFEVGDKALFCLLHHVAELEKRLGKLEILEAFGVDNWSGYDAAIREWRKNEPED
jgi:hypothetical protein